MQLEKNFFEAETRCGFFVSAKRKKVWAAEMTILEELGRICKKHNLHYFVDYGTLLGAVRHQGFIPWDDDIDVSMPRNDYAKLSRIAPGELGQNYFFQNSQTDCLVMSFSKLRDENTAAIEFWDATKAHQGIFIDIFPYDDVPEDGNRNNSVLRLEKELWDIAYNEDEVREKIKMRKQKNTADSSQNQSGKQDESRQEQRNNLRDDLLLDTETIELLLGASEAERVEQFEKFCENHYGTSACVNYILDEIYLEKCPPRLYRRWVEDTILLPFENMMVPAPKHYEEVLTQRFGDWHVMRQGGSAHEGKIYFDTQQSYREILKSQDKIAAARRTME